MTTCAAKDNLKYNVSSRRGSGGAVLIKLQIELDHSTQT